MCWTLTTEFETIHVRAIINTATQQDEIRHLIAALEKRLTKENLPNERPAPSDV
jgi:hypothetical protein